MIIGLPNFDPNSPCWFNSRPSPSGCRRWDPAPCPSSEWGSVTRTSGTWIASELDYTLNVLNSWTCSPTPPQGLRWHDPCSAVVQKHRNWKLQLLLEERTSAWPTGTRCWSRTNLVESHGCLIMENSSGSWLSTWKFLIYCIRLVEKANNVVVRKKKLVILPLNPNWLGSSSKYIPSGNQT